MNIIGLIPARYGSTRFPGKPLADIDGVSMIMRVVRQAGKCSSLARVVVATDDERIREHVLAHDGEVVMTSSSHPSGTDRCLDALRQLGVTPQAILNIQGDEPFVDPVTLSELCSLISRENVQIATLATPILSDDVLHDPNRVKVVIDENGKALYFSRHPIPYQKNREMKEWLHHHRYFKHLGLYAYRTEVLHQLCSLPPSSLELAESLEQLRWMEAGYPIHVGYTEMDTPSVDSPEDLVKLLSSKRK
jgi:3-deoxy-manno-octulosonate cytidylyltransferase (CMP-KDO synthetase)